MQKPKNALKMPHVIKKIARLTKIFFTPTFLALSLSLKNIAWTENHSLFTQQFDLNTFFSRISLPVSNTLEQNYR